MKWCCFPIRETLWRMQRTTGSSFRQIHHITWIQQTILHSKEAPTPVPLLMQAQLRDVAMTGLDSAAKPVSKSKFTSSMIENNRPLVLTIHVYRNAYLSLRTVKIERDIQEQPFASSYPTLPQIAHDFATAFKEQSPTRSHLWEIRAAKDVAMLFPPTLHQQLKGPGQPRRAWQAKVNGCPRAPSRTLKSHPYPRPRPYAGAGAGAT